jgi:hypothetical protein
MCTNLVASEKLGQKSDCITSSWAHIKLQTYNDQAAQLESRCKQQWSVLDVHGPTMCSAALPRYDKASFSWFRELLATEVSFENKLRPAFGVILPFKGL